MIDSRQKIAVVLFQLGGPDSLNAVEPFLYNLFMDPDIISFPLAFLARQPLAKLISSIRSKKVRENYKLIGGKSPIAESTQQQTVILEQKLNSRGIQAKVFVAMRYWHPLTIEIVQKIKADNFNQIILLPLYPQFSQATTYSSLKEWNRRAKKYCISLPTKFICCYPNHPLLIDAFVENINLTLMRFSSVPPQDIHLVFSAHGLPIRYIQNGDPYQLQVEETMNCVLQAGGWNIPHTLCYQSKVGPMKWLKPSLIETIHHLALAGCKYLVIVPIAFVTDHIETLHEINIEARKEAALHGISQFELIPALNDQQKYMECLADLASSLIFTDGRRSLCETLWKKNSDRFHPKLCPWIKEINVPH